MVCVIRQVSFLQLWFQSVFPLMGKKHRACNSLSSVPTTSPTRRLLFKGLPCWDPQSH